MSSAATLRNLPGYGEPPGGVLFNLMEWRERKGLLDDGAFGRWVREVEQRLRTKAMQQSNQGNHAEGSTDFVIRWYS